VTIKFFWKEGCPRCPEAKKLLEGREKVEYFNVDEVNGLAEAAYFGVISTPSIVIADENGKEIVSWRGCIPAREELERWLH
jgi:thioredoxin-related protein